MTCDKRCRDVSPLSRLSNQSSIRCYYCKCLDYNFDLAVYAEKRKRLLSVAVQHPFTRVDECFSSTRDEYGSHSDSGVLGM